MKVKQTSPLSPVAHWLISPLWACYSYTRPSVYLAMLDFWHHNKRPDTVVERKPWSGPVSILQFLVSGSFIPRWNHTVEMHVGSLPKGKTDPLLTSRKREKGGIREEGRREERERKREREGIEFQDDLQETIQTHVWKFILISLY